MHMGNVGSYYCRIVQDGDECSEPAMSVFAVTWTNRKTVVTRIPAAICGLSSAVSTHVLFSRVSENRRRRVVAGTVFFLFNAVNAARSLACATPADDRRRRGAGEGANVGWRLVMVVR